MHACAASGTPALLLHHHPPVSPQVSSVWALQEVQSLKGHRYHDLLAVQCGAGEGGLQGAAAAASLIASAHPVLCSPRGWTQQEGEPRTLPGGPSGGSEAVAVAQVGG